MLIMCTHGIAPLGHQAVGTMTHISLSHITLMLSKLVQYLTQVFSIMQTVAHICVYLPTTPCGEVCVTY